MGVVLTGIDVGSTIGTKLANKYNVIPVEDVLNSPHGTALNLHKLSLTNRDMRDLEAQWLHDHNGEYPPIQWYLDLFDILHLNVSGNKLVRGEVERPVDPNDIVGPVGYGPQGFLPPDDANANGEGFVSYSIQPKANAVTGTRYDAVARIVFDTEAPIDTPAIFNTADVGRPTTTVQPLPVNTPGSAVTVSWPGSDDTGGSGVAKYNVYTSVNGGPWTTWLSETTSTNGQYTGTPGSTLAFYAVASDNVGLSQFTPSAAQASTTLGSSTIPTGTVNALPSFSKGTFAVTWHTTSVPSGVTVTGYDVYVSVNGGAFTRWKTNTTATTANYLGSNGQMLDFAVVPLGSGGTQGTAPTLAQATTTVDAAAPTSSVATLPASQATPTFTVNWSGSDGAGSGINRYTVFVSVNGAAFTPWQSNTTQTSASYMGIAGSLYAFSSVATDNVGNVQPTPTSAQATTQITGTGGHPTVDRIIVALDQAQRSRFFHVQVVFSEVVIVNHNSFDLFLNNRRFVISGVTTKVQNGPLPKLILNSNLRRVIKCLINTWGCGCFKSSE